MSVKTQGTELFFVDRSGTPALVKMAAPTGLSGLGGAADQIDSTNLEDLVDKTFVRGLGNPGLVSVPFILKPSEASHQSLFTFKDSGEVLDWIACLSETATDPTLSAGNEIVPPTTRTSFTFEAYIADVEIDVATNEIVRGTLTLQRSGAVTVTWPA